jgi:hypothetical protein
MSLLLGRDYLDKLKELAYWERKTIKEVIDEVLGFYLKGKRIKLQRGKKGRRIR